MTGSHFEETKGYEYYKVLRESIESQGLDAMTEFFMSLQVWGTPTMCYEKIKDIQAKTNSCGFTGIFSYAGMDATTAQKNMELFATAVMPDLKTLGPRPLFDRENDEAPMFVVGRNQAA